MCECKQVGVKMQEKKCKKVYDNRDAMQLRLSNGQRAALKSLSDESGYAMSAIVRMVLANVIYSGQIREILYLPIKLVTSIEGEKVNG
jgi:hypothetical protein